MTYIGDTYGLKSYGSLKEEMELPENIKRTRHNKVNIITKIDLMARTLDSIRSRAYGCPELDDKKHADLVEELNKKVEEIDRAIDEAFRFGWL